MKKLSTINYQLLAFVIFFLWLWPLISLADHGLVPCHGLDCDFCALFQLIQNILNFIFLQVTLPLAVILFIVGGAMIIIGGANPKLLEQGKSVITGTVIGLAIIALSWSIINFIMVSFTRQPDAPFPWPWNDIQCD